VAGSLGSIHPAAASMHTRAGTPVYSTVVRWRTADEPPRVARHVTGLRRTLDTSGRSLRLVVGVRHNHEGATRDQCSSLLVSMRVRRTKAFADSISRATARHAAFALAIVAWADSIARRDCSMRTSESVTVRPLCFDEGVHLDGRLAQESVLSVTCKTTAA